MLCFFVVRQPFSSILSTDSLPTGPFDHSPMLWDGSLEISSQNHQNRNSSLIPLNSQMKTSNTKIQIKVIGKRSREPEPTPSQHDRVSKSYSNSLTSIKHNTQNTLSSQNSLNSFDTGQNGQTVQVPYIPAQVNSRPVKSYRTYGKKRYVIGPEYADFVCRLQNDIPFDSSEDDDEAAEEDEQVKGSELGNVDSDSEDEEEEERESVKISAQELLELFEDSCSGLPGLISAFLTHRKHQIGLKGYKPRANPSKTASAPPLLTQLQFDQIRKQIGLHFQFLIQNLALSNEIEGGEGVTLVSLKLLVQLHLHLDLVCNLRSSTTINTTGISCLTLPTPRYNPICSRLNGLIPAGIKKVSIIAGFLVRPGQKQFLSLSALRVDSTLKPKTIPSTPPLTLKIKNSSGNQLLSKAFYNILALFHDYIDAKLLDQTISVTTLSKYLEMGSEGPQSTRTSKFLPSEDNLLLCGLHRFGCGNWESIQAQFLPFRTGRQLAIRYKNLSSRREPINPIKEFNERLMMPLSEIEEDLLCKGVQRFGNQFHLISKHYLPHRPATVLGKLWKAMDDAGRNK